MDFLDLGLIGDVMVVLTKRFRTILLTNSSEYLEEDLNLEEEDLSYI